MEMDASADKRAGEADESAASAVEVTQEPAVAPTGSGEPAAKSAEEFNQSVVQDAVLVAASLTPLVKALLKVPFA
jgi:hypothetical protein